MRSSDRLRRRDERTGHEPQPAAPTPAHAPDIAAILALQQSAGNRALQRLMFNPKTYQLAVPKATYGDKVVDYNGQSRSIAAHANDTASDFAEHLANGLRVSVVDKVGGLDEQAFRTRVETFAADGPDKKDTAKLLGDVAVDPHRMFKYEKDKTFATPADVAPTWVMSDPADFIPTGNDLPAADADLKTTPIEGRTDHMYWEYACVLIALVKLDEGMTNTTRLLRTTPAGEDAAVQALHSHYVKKKTYYDDTSTRFKMMADWGYTPVFMGNVTWNDLSTQVKLTPQNKYIFDITGHTLTGEVTTTFPTPRKMANPKSYITPHSHPDNWKDTETFKDDVRVKFVWQKK